jgi:transcriptional regulator with XRE-family HTH domain
MTNHPAAQSVANEVRAEMARQRKTQLELAEALGVNAHTAGRRIRGEVPFDVVELESISSWLGVPITQLWPSGAEAVSA